MFSDSAPTLKSALVIERGLTEAIAQLWLQQAKGRIQFSCRIFHTLGEAEKWIH
jgi:hypothetical protein